MNKIIDELIRDNIICHAGGMIYECTDGAIFYTDHEADTHCEMNDLDKFEVTEEKDDRYYIVNEETNRFNCGFSADTHTVQEIEEMYKTTTGKKRLFDKTRVQTCKEHADVLLKPYYTKSDKDVCNCEEKESPVFSIARRRRRPIRQSFYTLHNH